jgi:hypothetical protein
MVHETEYGSPCAFFHIRMPFGPVTSVNTSAGISCRYKTELFPSNHLYSDPVQAGTIRIVRVNRSVFQNDPGMHGKSWHFYHNPVTLSSEIQI